jgi:hypothetical protein
MSSTETVSLVFEAEISSLRAALEGIPGISAKEAKKITASHLAALRATEAAAKKAASATARAAEQQAKEAAKVADEARDGLLELGDAVGIPKDLIEKLGKGFAALNNPVTLAAVAVGGLAVAAVASAAGMVALVRAGAQAEIALRPFERLKGFDGVNEQAQANLRRADAALASIGVTADRTALALGAAFAPTVERAAFIAVKLGLAVGDAATGAANAGAAFVRLGEFVGTQLVRKLAEPVGHLAALLGLFGMAAKAAGAGELAADLRGAATAYQEWTASLGGAGGRLVYDALSAGVGALDGALGSYDERARALIGTQEQLTAEANRQGAAVDRAKLAWEALQKAHQGQAALLAAEVALARARAEGNGTIDARRQLIELEAAVARRAAEEEYLNLVRLGQGRQAQLILAEREELIGRDTQKQIAALTAARQLDADAARQGAELVRSAELELARVRAAATLQVEDRIEVIQLEGAEARRAAEEQYRQLVRLGQGREAQTILAEREAQIGEETQGRIREAERETERMRQDQWAAQLGRIQQGQSAAIGAAEAITKAVGALGALELQESTERLARIREAREGLGDSITRAQERQFAAAEAAEKRAALRAFRTQQAGALAEASIAGYQAVIQALTLGPIAGPIAAAAMAAAVGLQVAAIASQSPPSFHRGGLVDGGPRAGADPSERLAVVRAGEGVLTGQGVAAAGGREGLDRLNAGQSGAGGATVVHLQLHRRTLQTVLAEAGRGRAASSGRRNPHTGGRLR